MLNPKYSTLAVVFTIILIAFLAYASQLFVLELDTRQFYIFNTLVGFIWVTYTRCILTEAGSVPAGWQPSWQKPETFGEGDGEEEGAGEESSEDGEDGEGVKDIAKENMKPDKRGRIWGNADCKWCKRCKKWKPPRAHHCKTYACFSWIIITWPHFIKFLSYVIAACSYLEKFLVIKCYEVYQSRNLPAYLGPSLRQLILLIILLLVNTLTDFAIIILWIRIISNAVEGCTTIESWEQERHDALVRRQTVRKQMFPFDIGIHTNLCLFMGGGISTWWFPFMPNRKISEGGIHGGGGLRYEVNGFEKSWMVWPPPDPEKFGIQERRHQKMELENGPWTRGEYDVVDITAFRRRQREDMKRFQREDDDNYEDSGDEGRVMRGTEDLMDSYLDTGRGNLADTYYDERKRQEQMQRKWRNEEGESLADYGVDEDADMLDDEDSVPLAELLRRRREKEYLLSSSKQR
ncbi:hypothetical protein ABW20_dc0103509 [Dactylellina cionopaga]|nr:hypothetical protein ABW20_dc0103509 [Dactylellina cionopaga]